MGIKKEIVQLKPVFKVEGKESNSSRKFEITQANALLKLTNSKWKLDDDKYEWNGKELAKKKAK